MSWILCDDCRYPFWLQGASKAGLSPACGTCKRKRAAKARADLRATIAALQKVHARTTPPSPPRAARPVRVYLGE